MITELYTSFYSVAEIKVPGKDFVVYKCAMHGVIAPVEVFYPAFEGAKLSCPDCMREKLGGMPKLEVEE